MPKYNENKNLASVSDLELLWMVIGTVAAYASILLMVR